VSTPTRTRLITARRAPVWLHVLAKPEIPKFRPLYNEYQIANVLPTKINRTVPPELARKFSSVDLICLADRAVPAADTKDEGEFFRRLRPFYQNNRKFFGTLVTPLVQGIRVRGRFAPSALGLEECAQMGSARRPGHRSRARRSGSADLLTPF
jgi:hypothetical protein